MDQVRETMDPKEQLPALEASVQADVESAVEAVVDAEIAQAAVEEVAQMEPTPVEELPTGQSAFTEPASGYAYYKEAFRELFSEKKVLTVTQKDLTTVALEGAAGGAALTGLLLVLLRPR
jgi:sensitive to high expression protein 9, mitochondrial